MQIVNSNTQSGFQYKGLLSLPQEKTGKIIIHIHGMGGSILYNNFYPLMHKKYSESGYAFLAGEHQGSEIIKNFDQGEKSVFLGNAFEKFEDCIEDIQAWVDFAVEREYEEIWLQSHSLGPSKVAYYMHQKKPRNISGLIWLSPADMLGLVHCPEMIDLHGDLLSEAKELKKRGKGKNLLSKKLWGEYLLSGETYINFFGKGSNTAIFNYFDTSLGWEVVNSIEAPVLAITGTEDDGIKPVMNPQDAMNLLEKQLEKAPRVKTIVYKGAEHSFNGFERRIVDDVLEFICNN